LTNGVIFIQWTDVAGQLTGSAQAVYLSGATTNVEHETIGGNIEASSISLTVQPDGLYGTSNLSGQLEGSGLVLSIPNSNGTLVPVTFVPGTVASFDSDVAALDKQSTQTSNAQVQQQEQAQATANLQQQESASRYAAATVASDISGMPSDVSAVAGDVAAMRSDLGSEATDLKTAETDAATALAQAKQYPGGNDGQVCSDAATAASDVATVSSDADTVESDAYSIEDDITSVRSDQSGLESDWHSYLSSVPAGYVVANAPSESNVQEAINSASAEIAKLISQANSLIGAANSDVTTAFNAANAASQAGRCGPVGYSTPVTTIPA
jgi:hypothetical protein